MIEAHGVSDVGPVRPINEDAMLCDVPLGLFMVADGMGGHNAGEVASRIATETVRSFFQRSGDDDGFTWPFGIDPRFSYDANRVITAVKLANKRVFQAAESRGDYTGMGTTVALACVAGDRLTVAGVGDSRVYLLSGGTLTQVTHDDSWLAMILEQQPGVDLATLDSHPMRHVLTNVVGAREETEVRVEERTLQAGDRVLLASDGLHSVVDEAAMRDALVAAGDPRAAAGQLVALAIERGTRDNITAVVVKYSVP